MREHCPKKNLPPYGVGRANVFGVSGVNNLVGSILDPDNCIVDPEGECIRHKTVSSPVAVDYAKVELSMVAQLLVAVEFGYRECEKGYNLQQALSNARKTIEGKQPQ